MRAKIHEFSVGGVGFQQQINDDGSGNLDTATGNCTGTIDIQTPGRESWIRHEVCIDITTDTMSSRQRATLIETGLTDTVYCGPAPIVTPADFTLFWLGNLTLQTLGNPALVGSRYVTYALQTRMPLDPGFWPGPATELEADPDADGLVDANDNCTQVANPAQQDIEDDGCGNVCDGDFNDNGATEAADFSIFAETYLKSSGETGYDARADMNSDEIVSIADFILFRREYLGTPGPGKPNCP